MASKKPRKKYTYKNRATKQAARANLVQGRKRNFKATKDPLVKVTLKMRHFVNGMSYGPGEGLIPQSLATQFSQNEANAIKQEEKLFKPRGVIIGRRGRSGDGHVLRDVPHEIFDLALGDDASIMGSISGKS